MMEAVDLRVWLTFVLLLAWSLHPISVSGQGGSTPAPALLNETCEGVVVQYQLNTVTKIYPFLGDKDPKQPYKFGSSLTLTNQGFKEVKDWQAFVGFQHREILVDADGVVLGDGQQLPASVGNGTILSGFPNTDLKNSIETAGDITQISVTINLTGTEFGVAENPLPNNISLLNEGWKCGHLLSDTSSIQVCCVENATTADLQPSLKFLPREVGDITISYDVLQTVDTNYWAQVTISNYNPLGRLDYWNLTWEWSQGEFIFTMQGAATVDQDQTECLTGVAGTYYKQIDFSQVMSCQRNPVFHDLPLDKTNDTKVGLIPFCCRNGTLLPPTMDPSKSKSAFKLQVFKVPPNLPRDQLVPPVNWNIGFGYICGQPRLVAPFEFPDPSSNFHLLSAVRSWQLTCNITSSSLANGLDTSQSATGVTMKTKDPPRCCVSFSAFYNTSAVPCRTCACGCTKPQQPTCNTTAEPLLVPYNVLLLPFENRTSKAVAWATMNHFPVPKQLPCGDNCGVNINWHIVSDYTRGWSARMSILNWDSQPVVDWFAAIELEKAMPGYQNIYSFNGTRFSKNNSTLLVQGLPGLNYLIGNFENNAGKVQSILSFTKDNLPGINIVRGDGFPSRVVFNGEECALPDIMPSGAEVQNARFWTSFLMTVLVLFFLISMMDQ